MIRTGIAVLAGGILAAGGAPQIRANTQTAATSSTAARAEAETVTLPGGTAINAETNSSLDSKKAKVGDKVEAHITEEIKFAGKVIVPKGAKLEGHVTEATARSKGDSGSTLAIQFDRAIAKKGEEIPLHVAIVAIAAPASNLSGGLPGASSDPMAGAGAPTASGSPMGTSHTPTASPGVPNFPGDAGSPMGANGSGQLRADSRGVYGMKDLKLMEASSNAGPTTVIVSSGKSVRLDSGTRLLLVPPAEAQAAASK